MNSRNDGIVVGVIDVRNIEIRGTEVFAMQDIIDTDTEAQTMTEAAYTGTFGEGVTKIAVR